MINFSLWLAVGGLVGWLTSVVMHPDGRRGIALNVVVGVAGAAIGGWILSPLMGVDVRDSEVFNVGALLVSMIGSVVLLALINLVRRDTVR